MKLSWTALAGWLAVSPQNANGTPTAHQLNGSSAMPSVEDAVRREVAFTLQEDIEGLRDASLMQPPKMEWLTERRYQSTAMKLWRFDLLASNRMIVNAAVRHAQREELSSEEIAKLVKQFSIVHREVTYLTYRDNRRLKFVPTDYPSTNKKMTAVDQINLYLHHMHTAIKWITETEHSALFWASVYPMKNAHLLPPAWFLNRDRNERVDMEFYSDEDLEQDELIDMAREDFVAACKNGVASCRTDVPFKEDPWMPHKIVLARIMMQMFIFERAYFGHAKYVTKQEVPFLLLNKFPSLFDLFPVVEEEEDGLRKQRFSILLELEMMIRDNMLNKVTPPSYRPWTNNIRKFDLARLAPVLADLIETKCAAYNMVDIF